MTQIKLRRDTSANFASKNPVLGLGEPAYETDTKKLKIGDGTTAYTQLEYFSAGGGGSADIGAALPLKIVNGVISLEVDGQTIQVVDGKLAASTNIVTTNTAQTITGNKTFRYIGIDDAYGGKTRLGDGQSKIEMAYDGQISLDSATILADQSQNWRVGRYNKAGLIYSASPLKRVGDGPTFTNYDILDSSNLGNHVDGTTIAYADGKLKATFAGVEVCDIGMALYVDETKGLRRYLNGQIVDINTNTQAFLNRLKEITTLHPSLLCTEDEWQTAKTMSAFGQVGKFVFNYSGENIVSVRLPRVVNVQGLFDLQNLGMTVSESLPNITASVDTPFKLFNTGVGAFTPYSKNYHNFAEAQSSGTYSNLAFDASRSSSTYKDNAPVQQEAIQYPYFIQIATGAETENNIINEIELNNPYSLFDSKYSDHELNNLSWLKSEGQWNAKTVYTTAYDKLLKVYNGTETVEGLSVKLSTEEYTDYDFVLNTAEETFRLPLLDGSESLLSGRYVDLELKASGASYTAPANGWYFIQKQTTGANQYFAFNNTTSGVYLQDSKAASGATLTCLMPVREKDAVELEYNAGGTTTRFRFIYARGNDTLYFYVGETVQNANLIDAGRIGEVLPTKTDKVQAAQASMPSDKFIDLTLGASGSTYTAPANGYFYIKKVAGNDWYYVRMRNDISNIDLFVDAYRTSPLTSVIPAKKGENVYVYYNATGATVVFRFIYAEGSK